MDNEEIVKNLKSLANECIDSHPEYIETLRSAIQIIKSRTKRKPEKRLPPNSYFDAYYRCPNCGRELCANDKYQDSFCRDCGQMIDWSNKEIEMPDKEKLKEYLSSLLYDISEYHPDLIPEKNDGVLALIEKYLYWGEKYNDRYIPEQDKQEPDQISMYLKQEFEKYLN